MSATIAVRTCGGQVLHVPPMRLSWATEHPEIIKLIDRVRALNLGGTPGMDTADEIDLCRRFLAAVVPLDPSNPQDYDADLGDVIRVYGALRGIEDADPTARPPG